VDPWHIIELLVLGLVGLGWRTLDTRLSEARAKIVQTARKMSPPPMPAVKDARREE